MWVFSGQGHKAMPGIVASASGTKARSCDRLAAMILTLVTLAALCMHIAGVFAAMHAVMHTRTAQGAFAWVLGLVLLPYVPLVPYLFLGSSHFGGYVDLHRQRQARFFLLHAEANPT